MARSFRTDARWYAGGTSQRDVRYLKAALGKPSPRPERGSLVAGREAEWHVTCTPDKMQTNSKFDRQLNEDGTITVKHLHYPRFTLKVLVTEHGANSKDERWDDDRSDFDPTFIAQLRFDATIEATRFFNQ